MNVRATIVRSFAAIALFRWISLVILFAGMMGMQSGRAQSICSYSITGPLAGATLDVGGTSIAMGDNQMSSALPIGFSFNFYGNTYANFYISSNGFITFTGAQPDGCCIGESLPQASTINNLIAAAWHNLDPSAGGSIGYNVFGTSPNRRLSVTFFNVPHSGGANPVTFQIKVYESSNIIEIHTQSQPSTATGHTMGLENSTGTLAVPVPGRNASSWTTSNERVSFTPQTFTLGTTQTNILCNGATTGSISLTGTGGGGGTQYSVNNGANYQGSGSFTGLGAGSYTAIARDQNGCTTQPSPITLTEPPAIIVNAGPDDTLCDGSSMTLSATATGGTGTLTPSWSPPAGLNNAGILQPVATPNTSTTYTLTITDANNCSRTDNVVITLGPVPTASFIGLTTPVCASSSSQLLTGNPGTGVFSGPGMTNNVFIPSSAGAGTHTISYIVTNSFGCADTATQTAVVNANPVTTITGLNATYCEADPAASLTVSPPGGTLTGPGIGGTIFTPATAGVGSHIITYSYTDGNGCGNTTNNTVQVNPTPTVNFTGLLTNYCVNGNPATLIPNPAGGTFSGPGVGGTTFDPSSAGVGTHTVVYTYTNGSGCSNSTSQSVTVNAIPSVSFNGLPSAMCSNDAAVTLSGNPNGGVFSGNGINGSVFDPLFAGNGTHSITYSYTDVYGCSNSQSQSVTVNAQPQVGFTGLANSYCADEPSSTLTPSPVGGTFAGTGVVGNSFDPAVSGPGSFTVNYSYTDAGTGCSASASQTTAVFAVPVVNLGNDTTFCFGGSLTLDAGNPGSTYVWSTNAQTQTLSVNSSGTYYVDVTGVGGCFASDSITITTLAGPTVNVGPDQTICTGQSVTLDAGNPGATYQWTPGNLNTQTVTATVSGTYSVVVTAPNGCTGTDAATITVMPLPVVNLGPDLNVCAGNPINLNAGNAGSTYSWTPAGQTSQSISVTQGGTYGVVVINQWGCRGSDSVDIVINAAPSAAFTMNMTNSPTIVFTDASTGTPTSWSWAFGDGATSTLQNPTHTYPTQSAQYTVTLSVSNACGATSSNQLLTIGTPQGTEAGAGEWHTTVYPNPSQGVFRVRVEGQGSEDVKVVVFGMNGQVIREEVLTGGMAVSEAEIDLSQESRGIYFVRCLQGDRVVTVKVVVRD